MNEDDFTLEMIDGGAEEVELQEGTFMVISAFEDFGNIMKKLEEIGVEPESAELQRIPHEAISLPISDAKQALTLIETLEEDDDVSHVFHNLEMTEELLAAE
jgi:transcriptional/translational regulatory protein YebC/TACO1